MGIFSWMESLFETKKAQQSLAGSAVEEGFVSKDLFYEILDLEKSVVLFFSQKTGWIGANKAFFEIFDYANIDAFRSAHESIRELFVSESEEVFTEYDKSWLDYLRIHKKGGYGIIIKDKEGRERTFMAKCRMIKQKGTELYVLELDDVTALELAKHQAEEIERLKTKFLSNIGHEFRTPMNGILGFIEMLEKSNPNEEQKQYLDMVHTSARSLMSNIESLLDLAQMQSGRLRVTPSEFNPISELEELAHIYAHIGQSKGISVTFFIDPKLPAFMDGDFRKVKQVLNSLVSNGMKFTKQGGKVNVEVKLLKRERNRRCSIGFSVKDNGKGIAKEQIAMITQPFVSGDQADERMGVGLSLSQGLVQLLGGKLSIHSEVAKGSTFTFALEFDNCDEKTMRLVEQKSAKVVLLDEKRIEEANLLTAYLRSFGLHVIKVNMLDDITHANVDMVYLVASQEEPAWVTKIENFPKNFKATLLLENGEILQTRTAHVIEHTLENPLVPSQVSRHLTEVFKLPKAVIKKEQMPKKQIRALVAEDNLINQRLIKILLKEYGIEVTTVLNGLEAVRECSHSVFDIVFMDIDMPVKDGILATQEIKAQKNPGQVGELPIIALTAMAMEGDRENILAEGLDDYLSKPLTRDKLEHILEKHLGIQVERPDS